MKIYLITADYRNPPVNSPYAVRGNSVGEVRRYFGNKFPWLKIFKGAEEDIKWFW